MRVVPCALAEGTRRWDTVPAAQAGAGRRCKLAAALVLPWACLLATSEAKACECAQRTSFWEQSTTAKTIVAGEVVRHTAFSEEWGAFMSMEVAVRDVLRGEEKRPTLSFQGGPCCLCKGVTIASFPIGSRWAFIVDGPESLGVCSGRFHQILLERESPHAASLGAPVTLDTLRQRLAGDSATAYLISADVHTLHTTADYLTKLVALNHLRRYGPDGARAIGATGLGPDQDARVRLAAVKALASMAADACPAREAVEQTAQIRSVRGTSDATAEPKTDLSLVELVAAATDLASQLASICP